MTAVEWLVKKTFTDFGKSVKSNEIKMALEMEKQQIIDAYWGGLNGSINDYSIAKEVGSEIIDIRYGKGAEQYYNDTYGSNGSDEISKVELNTSFDTSSQIEISDEEIEKEADKETSIEWLIKELKLEGYDHTIKVAKKMYEKEIDECSKKRSIQKINPSDFMDEMFKNAGKRD